MSKSFWSGMRVGWIRAEPAILATIAARRPAVDLGTPILEQLAATRLLKVADEQLASFNFSLLEHLGYSKADIETANTYCCGAMTVEGAPHLKAEHLHAILARRSAA